MKNKLIAIIISVCVIGGIGTAIAMSSKENDSKGLANNVVQEKSIDNNKDDNKSQKEVKDKEVEAIDDNCVQSISSENSNSNKVSVDEQSKEVNKVSDSSREDIKDTTSVENSDIVNDNKNTATAENNDVDTNNSNININEEVSKPTIEVQNQSYNSNFMVEVENMIFNKVNEERSKNGLTPLSYNSTMEHYARIKSQDMGDRGYFDHKNPEGELMTAQMQRDGVSYNSWGENIAYIGGVSDASTLANQFMTNWMNSSGHRANILSSNFNSIGIGVYKIGNTVYATQEFYK